MIPFPSSLGAVVEITGLVSAPQLNGTHGRIEAGPNKDSGRICVRRCVDRVATLVKPDNLILLPMEVVAAAANPAPGDGTGCLGPLALDGVNHVPPGSALGRLPRHPLSKRLGGRLLEDDAQIDAAFNAMFNGDVIANYYPRVPGGESGEATVFETVFPVQGGDDFLAVFSLMHGRRGTMGSVVGTIAVREGIAGTCSILGKLSDRRMRSLMHRIMHFCIRSKHWTMDGHVSDAVCTSMGDIYGMGHYSHSMADQLDASIICCDMQTNGHTGCELTAEMSARKLYHHLYRLGEVLESSSRFAEGAGVYSDMAAMGGDDLAVVLISCGLAHKRAGDFVAAEARYLESLQVQSRDGSVTGSAIVAGNLAHTWSMLASLYHEEWEAHIEPPLLPRARMMLWALLYVAGGDFANPAFQAQNTGAGQVAKLGPQLVRSRILPPRMNRRSALTALVEIARASPERSGERDTFYQRLLSFGGPGLGLTQAQAGGKWSKADDVQASLETARKVTNTSECERLQTITMCDNPACQALKQAAQLLKCSGCKRASYCDHSCQRAHWDLHKKECAGRKKAQKKKKKKETEKKKGES
jgi:hypothetical protein